MRQFFSTILSQAYSRKKLLLGGLAIALFFSLAPLNIAEANVFSDILNGIKNLPISLPVLILVLPLWLVTSVLGAIAAILTNLMLIFAQASMSIGVTPANQELVNIGWTLSRNLVNITFILILVFIGLATILRLQSYQLQRTLPLLIIIAVLVNFSGVFVGFVVDIGNLIAGTFLNISISFGTFGDQLKSIGDSVLNLIKAENPMSASIQLIGQVVVLFIYYLLLTLVMFVIMLLFFARVVILWMLAILAPIAFACYILPSTKRFWTQWLQQLIQWSIIGIPISLFLYLTSKILAAGGGSAIKEAFGSPSDTLAQLIASVLGNAVPLVLLMAGVMISMQMAPAGAQGVINWGKKAGTRTAGWAAREGWRKIGSKTEAGAGAVRKRGQEIAAKAEGDLRTAKFGSGQWMRSNLARFGGKALSIASSGIELGSKEANARVHTRDEAAIAQGEKLAKEGDFVNEINKEKVKKPIGLFDTSKVVGIITGAIKGGKTDDLRKAIDGGQLSMEDIKGAYANAVANKNDDQRRLIEKAFWDKVQDGTLNVSDANRADIAERMKAQDITDNVIDLKGLMDKNPAAAQKILDEIFLKSDSNVTTALMRHPKKAIRDFAVKYAESKGEDWFINNRREDTLNTIISSGGRTMGVPVFGGLTRNNVNEKVAMRDAGGSVQTLRKERAQLELRRSTPGADTKGIAKRLAAIDRAIEYKEKSLGDLQGEQTTSQRDLEDAQKEIARLEKLEKSLQKGGGVLSAAERTILLNSYKTRAQAEQLLQKIGQELTARGLPAAPRPRGIPAQKTRLLSSEGPIGKVYQDWTRHQQTAQKIDDELRAIERDIQAIKDDEQRIKALAQLTEIGTIARGEANAAKTIKETVRKRLTTLRDLPNEARIEAMKGFEMAPDQSTRLRQAQWNLGNLKKIAEASKKEKRLESEP